MIIPVDQAGHGIITQRNRTIMGKHLDDDTLRAVRVGIFINREELRDFVRRLGGGGNGNDGEECVHVEKEGEGEGKRLG